MLNIVTLNPQILMAQPCNLPASCISTINANQDFGCTNVPAMQIKTFQNLLDDQVLLPLSQCENFPQFIVFDEPVLMNFPQYTFAAGSELIFMNSESGINIPFGNRLNIKGSHLHGCAIPWKGLTVESGAALIIQDQSRLENAVSGIKLQKNSELISLNSEYSDNTIHILAGDNNVGTLPSSVTFAGIEIVGNIFSGQSNLTQPIAAIRAINAAQFYIGNCNLSAFPPNEFKDYSTTGSAAINSVESNIEVCNSTFKNIGDVNTGVFASGISTASSSGLNLLKFTGMGKDQLSPKTFENVSLPFQITSVRTTILDTKTTQCSQGVLYTKSVSAPIGISKLLMQHCTFDEICLKGVELGSKVLPTSGISILDNRFIFNSQNLLCIENILVGIGNSNFTNFANAENLMIARNTILHQNNPNNFNSLFRGIELKNMSGAKIENNVIQDNQQSGMLDSKGFAGIDIQAADNSKISGNTVTGAGTDYTAFKSCINVKESYNTEVRCNNVDNADRGITFDGYNCDATHLFSNDIHSHDEGLYLENNTVIGDQPFQGNRWFGSAAQIEGFFNFIGYNPAFSNDVKFVNRSEFKVSPIDQSHIFWANPRQVGNWDDMDFKWFKQESAQSEATCATINPTRRLSILNEEVVDGLYEPKDGYTANEREAAIHTFHRLLDYPELRPANSPALTWYNETLPSKIGKLVEAYDWLGDMTNTNVTIESNHSQLENVLLAHKAKQEEISTCSNATQLEILRQELSVINAEIIDAQSDLAQVVGAQTNVSNSEAQAHINALNGLSLLEEDEIDLRRVLVLQLSQCMAPTGYDPAQLSALSAIADKCRIADGLAVVLARSVLGNLDETHTADEECTVPRSAQKSASNTSSTIFPNPTSGVLNLNWAKTVETGKIVLVDLLGHQLKIWSVANTSNFSTMLNDVPAGTYFLNILVDGQAPESKRFFLSK